MNENRLLKLSIFATLGLVMLSNKAMAKDYKLGVVLFPNYNIEQNLDDIKSEIARDDVYREKNGDTLQLVVQSEISWSETNPSQGKYNFNKFVNFAKECKKRGIKWTPLFSPHYVPSWAMTKYHNDRITDKHGNIIYDYAFLKFSPSSEIWDNEIKKWIEKGLEVLAPYIGNGKDKTISEILVTNEMAYPAGGLNYGDDSSQSKITTYDDATIKAWNKRYSSRYGEIPRNIIYESIYRRDAFFQFRAEELAYCLNRLKSYTENKLKSLGKYNIPVSYKMTPYAFDAGRNTLEQYRGLTGSQLSYLFNDTNLKMIAIDEYEGSSGWTSLKNAIDKVKKFNHSDTPIYLAEFNSHKGHPKSDEIKNWILKTKNYGVNNWTYFSWNGGGEGNTADIEYEQKKGLKEAFDAIIAPDGKGNDPKNDSTSNEISQIVSPKNRTTIFSSTTFKWKNTNAKNYYLYVGTYKGGNNIYSNFLPKNTQSQTISIPMNGKKVYVRLWTQLSSGWKYKDYIYNTKKSNSDGGGTGTNPNIERFYNRYKSYFGSKSGSNYNCGKNLICQNYTTGRKIRVRTTDNYLYWYTNGRWNNYGIR
jgi:hypothetical protein